MTNPNTPDFGEGPVFGEGPDFGPTVVGGGSLTPGRGGSLTPSKGESLRPPSDPVRDAAETAARAVIEDVPTREEFADALAQVRDDLLQFLLTLDGGGEWLTKMSGALSWEDPDESIVEGGGGMNVAGTPELFKVCSLVGWEKASAEADWEQMSIEAMGATPPTQMWTEFVHGEDAYPWYGLRPTWDWVRVRSIPEEEE